LPNSLAWCHFPQTSSVIGRSWWYIWVAGLNSMEMTCLLPNKRSQRWKHSPKPSVDVLEELSLVWIRNLEIWTRSLQSYLQNRSPSTWKTSGLTYRGNLVTKLDWLHIWTQKDPGQVFLMCPKFRDSLIARKGWLLFVNFPDITFALDGDLAWDCSRQGGELYTLLFPATKHEPSEARLTDRIGTSPAGALRRVSTFWALKTEMLTSSWEQRFSDKSHCLMHPAWSQEMSSPWFGCTQTSLTGYRNPLEEPTYTRWWILPGAPLS
jgi:hypothetical protein